MRRPVTVIALVLVAGAAPLDPATLAPPPTVEFQGPPGSGKPNLATAPDGSAVLTWLEPVGPDRHALRYAVRRGGRWSAPGTVAERDDFFVNWADFPSIVVASDGRWVVHWLERTEAKPYAYHIRLTVSRDQGGTWSPPITAHSDLSPTEHGFVAMTAGPRGEVDLAWLDGRRATPPAEGEISVRFGTMTTAGTMGKEVELDAQSCECCQVAMARARTGLVVAFRDRSNAEIRDIAVTRRLGDKWTTPIVVVADGWEHRACPVNGPALTATGDRVTLAWYTAAGGTPRVWATVSPDGGATFGPRVRVDEGDPLGRLDAIVLGDGSTLVAWLEGAGQSAEWMVKRIGANGRTGTATTVAPGVRARQAGFPRMARAGNDVLFAYTDPTETGGVRVVRAEIP